MTQTLVSVVLFVILLAMVPFAIKWVQQRASGSVRSESTASRIVSVLAVGQHQRVVTVEVGPEGARTWLTLGVTAQSITCLHSVAIDTTGALNVEPDDVRAPRLI